MIQVEGEKPLLVEDKNGEIQETRLQNIPLSDAYDVAWSPDEQKLLITLFDSSAYVVDVRDD